MPDPAPREPRPFPGAPGRLLAGNPFQDESVAFRWLITILIAAATVVAAAKLVSGSVAVIWGVLLLVVFGYGLVRILAWLISSPDEDE